MLRCRCWCPAVGPKLSESLACFLGHTETLPPAHCRLQSKLYKTFAEQVTFFKFCINCKYNFNWITNLFKHYSTLIKQRGLYSPWNPELLATGSEETGGSAEPHLLQERPVFGSQLISQCRKLMHLRCCCSHPFFSIKTF